MTPAKAHDAKPDSVKPHSAKPDDAAQDDALALLARDHAHVRALFAQFESMGERAHVGKKKLADEICNELGVHTMVEEEIFYPAVRATGKENHALCDEALVEHAAAKELIGQIMEMGARDELFDAKVKVLSEQISHHVDEEENTMFPRVRKSKLDLLALGRQIGERKAQLGAAPV